MEEVPGHLVHGHELSLRRLGSARPARSSPCEGPAARCRPLTRQLGALREENPGIEALSGRAARRAAVASATGSIEAEGLHASNASDRDTEAYVKGDLDADTLVARAIARHRQTSERRAG
ncbi:hypothetical protein [Streptomyces sp. NBC_00328]|uniref:antitoxin VbhA family protein n=1 Tax=Streptomyces sp. NBC_00328 TaxID=2903646 RepID=UPI002E29012B|nr:hypothetical protein [Streptomyces sp. NBC_00328]